MSDGGEPFEGWRGPSLEVGCDWYRALHYENGGDEDAFEAQCDKYYKDPAFRKESGPLLRLFDEDGMAECLWGIQMDVDFGSFGKVRGIVRECDELDIEWRVGPDYDESTSYVTRTAREDSDIEILKWYFQEDLYERRKEMIKSWANEKTLAELKQQHDAFKPSLEFLRALATAPEGTKLVDWKEPYDCHCSDENYDDERWDVTMRRLNDPRMAHHYGGPESIPTPIVLLICAMSNSRLPTIVTKEKERMYSRADYMCRCVNAGDSDSVGYAQLLELQRIVGNIEKDFPKEEAKCDEKVWREGYLQAQALMLVMSSDFEEPAWDYKMCDDIERLFDVVGALLRVFTTFMTPSLAPGSAKDTLAAEREFNAKHLKAGSFVELAEEDASQDEEIKRWYDSFKELLPADESD